MTPVIATWILRSVHQRLVKDRCNAISRLFIRNPLHRTALEKMEVHTLQGHRPISINRRWIHPVDILLRVFATFVWLEPLAS
jgi:hypothetical protein